MDGRKKINHGSIPKPSRSGKDRRLFSPFYAHHQTRHAITLIVTHLSPSSMFLVHGSSSACKERNATITYDSLYEQAGILKRYWLGQGHVPHRHLIVITI